MKLSIRWLKDYVIFDLPVEKLAHRLTMAGHEVKGMDSTGNDSVFEIEITPNRPDCLNVIGLARETAAILNKPLRLPKVHRLSFPSGKTDISIEDKKGVRAISER